MTPAQIKHKICATPWALTESAYQALTESVVEAFVFDDDDVTERGYEIHDGVAVVRISGVLVKNLDFWGKFFGGYSYTGIREVVQMALNDSDVQAVLLSVDSPGGEVDGVKELSDWLNLAAKQKPVYAYADGTMCSATYWLGSVGKIFAPATAQTGSIGVRMMHVDASERMKQDGYKVEILRAGAYKAIGDRYEPLTDKGRAYLQDFLDRIYSIFVDDVARNRGMDAKEVQKMADGRVFLGIQAIEIGMVDQIVPDIYEAISIIQKEIGPMLLTEFQSKHADLYKQVLAMGKAEAEAEFDARLKTALAEKTDTVIGLVGSLWGPDAQTSLQKLVSTGVTSEMLTAMAASGMVPAQDKRAAILEGLKAAHTPPLASAPPAQPAKKDFMTLVNEHMAATGATKAVAMQAMHALHPEAHAAWLASVQQK